MGNTYGFRTFSHPSQLESYESMGPAPKSGMDLPKMTDPVTRHVFAEADATGNKLGVPQQPVHELCRHPRTRPVHIGVGVHRDLNRLMPQLAGHNRHRGTAR